MIEKIYNWIEKERRRKDIAKIIHLHNELIRFEKEHGCYGINCTKKCKLIHYNEFERLYYCPQCSMADEIYRRTQLEIPSDKFKELTFKGRIEYLKEFLNNMD